MTQGEVHFILINCPTCRPVRRGFQWEEPPCRTCGGYGVIHIERVVGTDAQSVCRKPYDKGTSE